MAIVGRRRTWEARAYHQCCWIMLLLGRCWCHAPKHDWGKHRGRTSRGKTRSEAASQQIAQISYDIMLHTRNPGSSLTTLSRRTKSKDRAGQAVKRVTGSQTIALLPVVRAHGWCSRLTTSTVLSFHVVLSSSPQPRNCAGSSSQPALAHGLVVRGLGIGRSVGGDSQAGPCLVGMHRWIVAPTSLKRQAAAPRCTVCILQLLLHASGKLFLYSVGCRMQSASSPRYTDHEFVARKTWHAAGLPPGNLVHEHVADMT